MNWNAPFTFGQKVAMFLILSVWLVFAVGTASLMFLGIKWLWIHT